MQYTILSGNTCICPDGRYQNLITLICLMCEPVCLTCIDAYTCSSCSALLKRVYNSATH